MTYGTIKYRVRDVMTTSVVAVKPESTVWEAVVKMDKLGVGAMPVINDEGKLVGIFTERDLLRRVVAKRRDPETTRIREVMTPNPVTIGPDEPIETARRLMAKIKARHLPVVDEEGRLIGIISIKDIEYVEA